MLRKLQSFTRLDNSPVVQAIRQGLVMMIPLLMIGSFALAVRHLPIPAYQAFLAEFAGGFLIFFFSTINQATFGILSLFMTITISYCYAKQKLTQEGSVISAVFTALSVNMLFNGILTEAFDLKALGTYGMFTAIFSAVAASVLYCKLVSSDIFSFRFYSVGADTNFNSIISTIFPALIVIILAYIFNEILVVVFGATSFEAFFHNTVNTFFEQIANRFVRTILFVVLTSVFWFFGIHGTNILESVAQNLFSGSVEPGAALVADILNKPFMDAFVFMGGCGTTLSLVLAIVLFSKQKNTKSLAKMAAFPMIFNINEMMIFGLPIIWNWSFFIPFISVPVVCTLISYAAIGVGIVPIPTTSITWVTPVLVGGYVSTGSIMGSLLQVFNIVVGAFIYRWFLLRYEKQTNVRMMASLEKLINILHKAEDNGMSVALLELKGAEGATAKMLAEDLRHVLKTKESFMLYYQPQYDNNNQCVGAEALLRWDHPQCGMIYPPLLIGIAQECNLLGDLERTVFEIACKDITVLLESGINPWKISVNATAVSLQDEKFIQFVANIVEENPQVKGIINIELTEQMSFLLREGTANSLTTIRDMGVMFAIDDFSMGHTSVKYLQSNLFNMVKLDGSLTKDIVANSRSREIISSIIHMSKTMGFSVLAEYVETTEQRDTLKELGCYLYQGYLFSPAIPRDKLITRLQREQGVEKEAEYPRRDMRHASN